MRGAKELNARTYQLLNKKNGLCARFSYSIIDCQLKLNPFDWQGDSVYFDVVGMDEGGELFDRLGELVREAAGEQEARGLTAALTFKPKDVRAFIDSGQ